MAITGLQLLNIVADAFGLPDDVCGIKLDLVVGQPPALQVTCRQYISNDDAAGSVEYHRFKCDADDHSMDLLNIICPAIGFDHPAIQRVLIDAEMEGVARVTITAVPPGLDHVDWKHIAGMFGPLALPPAAHP